MSRSLYERAMPAIALYQHYISLQTCSPAGTTNIVGIAHSYESVFLAL